MMKSATMPGTGAYVKDMISTATPDDKLQRFIEQKTTKSAREICESGWRKYIEATLRVRSHPPNEE
ncbi:hypothetical protein IJV57_02455 [Candidatus Saccharibacteria bacterium]|nr:hypothetical protein [Candidatus Saccharibacteria bacterium]